MSFLEARICAVREFAQLNGEVRLRSLISVRLERREWRWREGEGERERERGLSLDTRGSICGWIYSCDGVSMSRVKEERSERDGCFYK